MSVRCLATSHLIRFVAVLLLALAVSPVTQPFSTLGVCDLFEQGAGDTATAHDLKTTEQPAAIGALVTIPSDHGGCGEAILSTRPLTIDRHEAPVVLRI